MKKLLTFCLVAVLLWLAMEAPGEQKGLSGAAEQLQSALEENAVCAAIFGWEEPPTRL